jgi:hypothetical protein
VDRGLAVVITIVAGAAFSLVEAFHSPESQAATAQSTETTLSVASSPSAEAKRDTPETVDRDGRARSLLAR